MWCVYKKVRFKAVLCGTILFIGLNLLWQPMAAAQDMPGESLSIKSVYLNADREIQVALPKGYNESDSYDVQYMLDPKWNMAKRQSDLEFLRNNAMTPRTILVGIISTDRNEDMTPTHIDSLPTSGNADKFIQFIGEEVIPVIEKKYKTTGFNTFAGHSFGGLCVMYGFLTYPDYFDAYLVSDPSFWWDDNYMIKLAEDKLPKLENAGKVLFIGGRTGVGDEQMRISAMKQVLEKHAPDALDWKVVNYEDESHNSVVYKLNYDGIKFISQDYRNSLIKFIPNEGEVVPGEPMEVMLWSDNESIRYTLDGSEPDANSELFVKSISLTKPATLKIKVPLNRQQQLPARSGVFKEGKKLAGVASNEEMHPGLNYRYYEGDWKKLPDFNSLKPLKEGSVTDHFGLNEMPKKVLYGGVFEGFFEAKESGYHYFSVSSDDGLKFYIHDKLMIDNDWRHAAYDNKSTVLYLEKGLHPVRYEYFQHEGGAEINLYAKLPGKEPGRMDFSHFRRLAK